MNCAEFQKSLPYIIDTGGDKEHQAHLGTCAVCHDLVMDLKYIADQAKLLVPMEEPPERVWDGIQQTLESEGLVQRPTGPRGRLLGRPRARAVPWVTSVIALSVVTLGLALYHRTEADSANVQSVVAPAVLAAQVPSEQDDEQVVAAVADRAPSLREVYAANLRLVNTYITDARRRVEQQPNDEDARQSLAQAYEQKNMMYAMALSQSTQ